jgi:3-hydroxyisobutyrate dehydrogenase-like beta-hydroxyacid dehydrogenase
LAGDESAVESIRALLAPICRYTVAFGTVPNALLMKLSINLFLIAMVPVWPKLCTSLIVRRSIRVCCLKS